MRPFIPYLGLETAPRPPWADAFLVALSTLGLVNLAAAEAGISVATVRRARATDSAFAEQYDGAMEYCADWIEWRSLELGGTRGNPLPFFARLKAERPARYVEKSIVVQADISPGPAPEDARQLLSQMLGHVTDATRERLTGDLDIVLPLQPPAESAEPAEPGDPPLQPPAEPGEPPAEPGEAGTPEA